MKMAFVGFTHSPTFQIAGSYFPAWLLAIVIGVILMLVVRAVIARAGVAEFVRPPALVYLSMALTFTLLTWLILN
jgi:hypothetical protein